MIKQLGALIVAVLVTGGEALSATFTNIADYSTIPPGESSNYNQFLTPSLSGNNLSFQGFYTGGFGYFATTVGTGSYRIIDTSQTIPGHGTVASMASNGGISGSNVVVEVGDGSIQGIYKAVVGADGISKIVDTSTVVPGQSTPISDFGDAKISGSNIAFDAYFDSHNSQAVYSDTLSATGVVRLADTNMTAPGSGTFLRFGLPDISADNVAFWASSIGANGIYNATAGLLGASKLIDTSDPAPGHGNFTGFGNTPSISGHEIALVGDFSGGSGIYTATAGSTGVTTVSQTGDVAPGHGIFVGVDNPSISGSIVAFIGSYTSGRGIYFDDGAGPVPLLNTGDPLFGSTITSLSMGRQALDGNQLAFDYSLANGQSGIAVATFPEPGAIGLLLGATIFGRRQRRTAR